MQSRPHPIAYALDELPGLHPDDVEVLVHDFMVCGAGMLWRCRRARGSPPAGGRDERARLIQRALLRPVLGQFVSADSDAKGGLNRYWYVLGNPETATDPTGHRIDCMYYWASWVTENYPCLRFVQEP